ncbi:MAG: hypothetical protein JWN44_7066 [Myxococcales bacterium]|nr:hypothetical protein [Myxococcales bacterium]
MVRHTAIILAVAAVATVALAKPPKDAAPKQPHGLRLRTIDIGHRLVMIEVDGFTKAPPSNYFTMTDDRGRHYVAQTIHCDPPADSGSRNCELEIPDGYERHPLTSLELHVRGLHGKTVAVAAEDIKKAWTAAEEAHAAPPDGGSPRDGGAPLDSAPPRTDAGK